MSSIAMEKPLLHHEESLKDWLDSNSVPPTGGGKDAQYAIASLGIAEDLCSSVLQYFQCFWYGVRSLEVLLRNGRRCRIKKELEVFTVWCHGFRDGRLDEALEQSEPLKVEVLTILSDMAKLLLRSEYDLLERVQANVKSFGNEQNGILT
jgi:hypothetical protein